MPLDELLLAVALASYALGALALIAYFFSREAWLRDVGAPLAIMGCIAQFAQLGARWQMTARLAAAQPLRFALALRRDVGGDLYRLRFSLRLWLVGGFVLALAAIFLAYGVTWNEGTMPAVPSLQSYWAKIHVPIVVSSYAAFLVAFVFSLLISAEVLRRASLRTPRSGRAARDRCRRDDPGARVRRRAMPTTIRRDTPALSAAAAAGNPVAALARRASVAVAARRHRLSRRGDRPAADFDRNHHRRDVGQRSVGRVLAVGSRKRPRRCSRGSSISRTCISIRVTRGAACARTGSA